MTPLDKFREQVKIARDSGTFVVHTADEAQAVLDQMDGDFVAKPKSDENWSRTLVTHTEPNRDGPAWKREPPGAHDDAVES